MRHIAALAVLIVGPLTAAPVPKGIKAKAPSVLGTTWVMETDGSSRHEYTYDFRDDGSLFEREDGWQTFSLPWKQDGDVLTWGFGNRPVVCRLTFSGGKFEGTWERADGELRPVTLRPKEK